MSKILVCVKAQSGPTEDRLLFVSIGTIISALRITPLSMLSEIVVFFLCSSNLQLHSSAKKLSQYHLLFSSISKIRHCFCFFLRLKAFFFQSSSLRDLSCLVNTLGPRRSEWVLKVQETRFRAYKAKKVRFFLNWKFNRDVFFWHL